MDNLLMLNFETFGHIVPISKKICLFKYFKRLFDYEISDKKNRFSQKLRGIV